MMISPYGRAPRRASVMMCAIASAVTLQLTPLGLVPGRTGAFDDRSVAMPIVVAAAATVRVAAPTEGATFNEPAEITVEAAVADTAGVSQVTFFANSAQIGRATLAPYRIAWTDVRQGAYTLLAVSTDMRGRKTSSQAVRVQVVQGPAGPPLLQKSDLVYEGAFRLPGPDWGDATFAFGGTALAFSPERQSLFLVGHPYQQQVAEISVPEIRRGATVSELATATFLQGFAEITEGKMPAINPSDTNSKMIGGLLPYGGRLFATAYSYYDGAGTQQLSHFVSGLDLTKKGDVAGPYQLGTRAGFVSGYFGLVPRAWQAALGGPVLNGQCCLSIINRTSYGPAVFTMNPDAIGKQNPVPVTPLVYYPSDHPLAKWEANSEFFNGSSSVTGVVFPEGSRTVLFFGRHGVGPFCYGSGEECKDPADNSKGTHGYPYAYYVWAYDAVALAEVAQGRAEPWSVKPYATWTFDLPYSHVARRLMGATYDPATGRIFVTQANAENGPMPVIHVFTVATPKE